jgi:hypothetical protein
LGSAAALPASATLRAIAVQTSDIRTYRHEVETLQSPDDAVMKPNSALGATMKRVEAIRKITSASLYEELSP